MGMKAVTNSANGRAALLLIALCLVGFAICGATLWYTIFEPQLASSGAEANAKKLAPNYSIAEVGIVDEENQLDGLPSSTLSYRDVSSKSETSSTPGNAILFPLAALDGQLDSLVNVNVFASNGNSTATTGPAEYTLKFYASSLSDYSETGAYAEATRQFTEAYGSSVRNIDFTSAPTPSGGRVVDIHVTSAVSFQDTNNEVAKNIWNELVDGVSKSSDLNGEVVNLTLSDAGGLVTISTTIANAADIDAALAIPPRMWPTFSALFKSTSMTYLKVQKLNYSVERTEQDSTLTIQVDESLKETKDLRMKMWISALDSTDDIYIPGSYNIYLVTADDPIPFLASYSTSRNW